MSNVGDALSGGGSSASGVTDSTFSDASLGDQIMGGDGSLGTGDASAFAPAGGDFNSFSDIATALSPGGAGASDVGAQAAAMTPPGTAAATGGDPTGAASGTQSNTTPGSTPDQNQQQQTGGGKNQSQDPNYAPPQAVSQLKALLKQLNSGKPAGPTGPTPQGGQAAPFALPTLAAGQTGAQSPRMALPAVAAGQTGDQSPGSFYGTPVQPQTTGVNDIVGSNPADASIPPGAASQPAAQAERTNADGAPAVDAQGNPVTAAGTPAADTPLPPSRPGAQTADAGGGHDITVRKGAGAQPDLPTRVPHPALPTKKPGASPPPAQQPANAPETTVPIPPSRLIQDITGISTGNPTALADLAQAAGIVLPMIAGMFGGGGRGRRFGRFTGGRFMHGFGGGHGGFGHLHGGQHPAGRGAWPYHHPVHGWHFHGRPPGPGWRPLHPTDAQGLVGGGGGQDGQDPNQDPNQPDPNRPPKETGRPAGTPDQVGSSGAIPGASAKDVDDYTRQVAQGYGIDPDVASKILAQESSYGQARHPGDNGTSFGPFQLHFAADGNAMGDQFRRDTGLDPRDPRTWKQQVDYAMMKASQEGWTPWTTSMKKLGMNQWSGITTNRRYAGRMSNKPLAQETRVTPDMVAKLPPSASAMVAGP